MINVFWNIPDRNEYTLEDSDTPVWDMMRSHKSANCGWCMGDLYVKIEVILSVPREMDHHIPTLWYVGVKNHLDQLEDQH